jgi:cold shock CspA family protein
MTGIVKFFLVSEHYGFIRAPERDYFFHQFGIADQTWRPREGDAVTFDVSTRKEKILALNVQHIDDPKAGS